MSKASHLKDDSSKAASTQRRLLASGALRLLALSVLLIIFSGVVTGWMPWRLGQGSQPRHGARPAGSTAQQSQQQTSAAHNVYKLVTVVLYSSHESVYINALLKNALMFSDQVVLTVGARQFGGLPENIVHLAELQRTHPRVALELYPVEANETNAIALHNRGREYGVLRGRRELAKQGVPAGSSIWFLMLDGDEVPDGLRFHAWWDAPTTQQQLASTNRAFKMQNYWLFMLPRLVAEQVEDSVLLVHDSQLTHPALNHPRDRDGIWLSNQTLKVHRNVPGMDGAPLFWHYSWVRPTRAALLHKVRTWGHNQDRSDWQQLVDDAYALVKQGKVPQDFVHGYKLRWVAANDTSQPQPPVVW